MCCQATVTSLGLHSTSVCPTKERWERCLGFSSITHPNLHRDPLWNSVWLHEEVEQLQRDLPHNVMATMETNIPGVPVDSSHHEHSPAQPVPRVHIRAFQQQPVRRETLVRRDIGQERDASQEEDGGEVSQAEGKQNIAPCKTQWEKLIQPCFSSTTKRKQTSR